MHTPKDFIVGDFNKPNGRIIMAQSKKRADAQIDFDTFATGNIARGTSLKSLTEMVNANSCTIAEAMAYAEFMVAKSKPTSKGFIARWTKVGADLAKGSLGDTNVYFAKAKPIAKAKPKASVAPQGIAKLSKAQLVDIVQRFMAEAE